MSSASERPRRCISVPGLPPIFLRELRCSIPASDDEIIGPGRTCKKRFGAFGERFIDHSRAYLLSNLLEWPERHWQIFELRLVGNPTRRESRASYGGGGGRRLD